MKKCFHSLLTLIFIGSSPLFTISKTQVIFPLQSSYFLRLKVTCKPQTDFRIDITGSRHAGAPWRFKLKRITLAKDTWSEWIDLSGWKWHGKVSRSGGMAEYPSIQIKAVPKTRKLQIEDFGFEVELSESKSLRPAISFKRPSKSNTIIFLAPYPLARNAAEFETDQQMVSRHARWAHEATGGKPIKLDRFDVISNLWFRYDKELVNKEVGALKSLGFNVIGGVDYPILQSHGIRTAGKTWLYLPDPQIAKERWKKYSDRTIARNIRRYGNGYFDNHAYWAISDEVKGLNFRRTRQEKLDEWFGNYLSLNPTAKKSYMPKAKPVFPKGELTQAVLDRKAPLAERKRLFYGAKFAQWWSAKQLRLTSDLIRSSFPGAETSTLLPSHGFMGNALGPNKIGMSFPMLDKFEVAKQESVNRISSEDWMGLNHMYGPQYTWTGGQSFGYINALIRSAISSKEIKLQALITPSDDKYLRLKAFSALGQGAKSFYFWSFGPTFAGTENYWSDLRSEYDGIAKFNRLLAKTEDVLYPAKTRSDPVAILYSVSHDIWNPDRQAAFVEKRLLWHGLRHLQIQPNFVREEDVESGILSRYKVLYISDWNVTKKASAAIDRWVKSGGVLYLSAGAATHDEFNSHYLPAFAKKVWSERGSASLPHQKSTYNERTSLKRLRPLANVKMKTEIGEFTLPVLGSRLDINSGLTPFGWFEDGKIAGASTSYGKGKIIAIGIMPMLAYGQSANFKRTTLEEKWRSEPRSIIRKPLLEAAFEPIIRSDTAVVDTSFLQGPKGDAVVLVNYLYSPLKSLKLDIRTEKRYSQATSANGGPVKILSQTGGRVQIEVPLDWTDIIILR